MTGRRLATWTAVLALLAPLPALAQGTGGGAGRSGSFGNAGVNDQTGDARNADPNPGSSGITLGGTGFTSDKPASSGGVAGPNATGRETAPGTTGGRP